MKEKYMEPKETNLTETTDVRDILQLARDLCQSSTEEICDIFSMGINPELKKRFDYADLYSIGTDINRYETFSYFNPNLYIYEKQRHTKAMGLTDEESDKLRPYPSEPRLYPTTIMQAHIDDFILKTEDIIGQTTCMNDIKEIDGIHDYITLIKPKMKYKDGRNLNNHDNIENYGFKNIISDIRNGLMHNSYITYGDKVYINNPKGGKDENGFEAVVSFEFFNEMYRLGRLTSRKPKVVLVDEKSEKNIKWEKGYEANKDNLEITIIDTKKSTELMDCTDQGEYLNQSGISKTQPLSTGQKELLKLFFGEYAFYKESLRYAVLGMENKWLGLDFWHDQKPGRKNRYLLDLRDGYLMNHSAPGCFSQRNLLNTLTKGDDVNNRLIWNDEKYIMEFIKGNFRKLDGGDITKKDYLKIQNYVSSMKSIFEIYKSMVFGSNLRLDYLKILYISKFFINDPTLELARPQKREGIELKNQCTKFIMNKCKNKPDTYRSKESKQSNLNRTLGHDFWLRIFKQYTSGQLSTNQIIQKALEDRRVASDQRELLKNNIIDTIEKWEKQLDEVTIIQEPEHIRNAFAHHNYTIIPGFNKILLEDPSRNDFPDWRKVYDLNELYEYCLCNSKECFLGVK